jgi:hypothetical protein
MATWGIRILFFLGVLLLLAAGVGWYLERDIDWVTIPGHDREITGLQPLDEQVVPYEIRNDRWWPIRIVGLAQC